MGTLLLKLLATLVLAYWALHGINLVRTTWHSGYAIFWAAVLVLPTLGLVFPFIAIWL